MRKISPLLLFLAAVSLHGCNGDDEVYSLSQIDRVLQGRWELQYLRDQYFNSQGHLGHTALSKPPKKTQLLFTGDSYAIGHYSASLQTVVFSRKMPTHLHEKEEGYFITLEGKEYQVFTQSPRKVSFSVRTDVQSGYMLNSLLYTKVQ